MEEEQMKVVVDLRERLHPGANNDNLKAASLNLTKHEVDILYGLLCATIDYHEITKK